MAEPGRSRDVSDETIIDVLRNADDPVLTTAEVADAIDLKHRGTYQRLIELADQDRVQSKKAGAKATVWWIDE
jgi:hypothetical protein